MWGIHWPDFSIDGWCPGLPGGASGAELGTIWLSWTDLWDVVRLAWGAFLKLYVYWGPIKTHTHILINYCSIAAFSPVMWLAAFAVCRLQTWSDFENVQLCFCLVLVWFLKINRQYLHRPTVPNQGYIQFVYRWRHCKMHVHEWPLGVSTAAFRALCLWPEGGAYRSVGFTFSSSVAAPDLLPVFGKLSSGLCSSFKCHRH